MKFPEASNDEIKKLCIKYSVKSLYAFGSVNSSRFNDSSDIDLLVDLNTADPFEYTENYFELKFALENLRHNPTKNISNMRKIIDTKNRIVHGYDTVSDEILWGIVIRHLPLPETEVLALLK
jgi:hypothetical protein